MRNYNAQLYAIYIVPTTRTFMTFPNYKENLPCILGFMRSNYGQQVVILKEITACSITEKDNTYIKYKHKYCNKEYVPPSIPSLFQPSTSRSAEMIHTTQQPA
jgi:hypothetical protein